MGFKDNQLSAFFEGLAAIQAGHNIGPLRLDVLPQPRQAEPLEKALQVISQGILEELLASDVAAHRVDAGDADELT